MNERKIKECERKGIKMNEGGRKKKGKDDEGKSETK
jgi:hypothetical protein